MQTVYGKCSKNFIDCRKHPVRTTPAAKRVNEDFRNARLIAEKSRDEALAKFIEAQHDPESSKNALGRLQKQAVLTSNHVLAMQTEGRYAEWLEKQNNEIRAGVAGKKNVSEQQRTLNHISLDRENVINSIKDNVEKEIVLNKATERPLEGFKLAITGVLVKYGSAFDSGNGWDDTRGVHNNAAEKHLKEQCSPAIITDYQEDYQWVTRDGQWNDENTGHGICANISCKCGEVYDQRYVLENSGFTSIVELIMNE